MEKKFQGKTLLMLGSNVGSVDIVRYARENGAYTITADYLPVEKSPAKQIADEAVEISTGDLEGLSALIWERHVDAVLAGISEFNLLSAMALSQRFGLPFYCTRAQWDAMEKKGDFRALCQENGVPCPATYYVGGRMCEADWEKLQYPAVIKPVDASASSGVHICRTQQELLGWQDESLSQSDCGEIIVEEFAEGDEFTAHYAVVNGKATLSCVDNRYPVAVHEGQVTTVPVARVYPCLYLDAYMKQVDPGMRKLCESLGLRDAILFIQGIYNREKDRFYVFEAGLRCAGEAPYRFLAAINGVNAMHMLVDRALSVETDFDPAREDPSLGGKCCGVISFVARGGVVGSITGLEEAVKAVPSVIEHECRYPVGSTTPDGDTLRQLMIRFIMICDSREQMAADIAYLNEHITVKNEQGEDMVIKMMPERLFGTK